MPNSSQHLREAVPRGGLDAAAQKAEHAPSSGECRSIEGAILGDGVCAAMPVVAVRLDDQLCGPENKIRLPAPEHRDVHLKTESSLKKEVVQGLLYRCHADGKFLPESRCANFVTCGFRDRAAKQTNAVKVLLARERGNGWARAQGSDHLFSDCFIAPKPSIAASATTEKAALLDVADALARHGAAGLTRTTYAPAKSAKFRPTRKRAEPSASLSGCMVAREPASAVFTALVLAVLAVPRAAVRWAELAFAFQAGLEPVVRAHVPSIAPANRYAKLEVGATA